MIVRKKRNLAVLCAGVLLALLLTGCGCDHDWQKSTCQAPRTCRLCGETEGKIRAHEWANTDCRAPEGCVVCGTMEGMVLTHEWRDDCKICIHCGYDERPADDRFPDQLAAGLEDRWQLEAKLLEKEDYVLTGEDWEALFAAEYDRLASFREESFQDEALEAAALRYIISLEDSLETLEYFGTSQWEDRYLNGVYWEQAVALFEVNSLCTLSVAEEHREMLETMVANGEIIKMVTPLFEQTMFLHINTTGAGKKYETTIKNTTSLTFEWFSFDVNLLDENGKILDTQTSKVTIWKPDQKRRFNFTTKEEFAAIDVAFANWKLNR